MGAQVSSFKYQNTTARIKPCLVLLLDPVLAYIFAFLPRPLILILAIIVHPHSV